jgi:hypothetical protein
MKYGGVDLYKNNGMVTINGCITLGHQRLLFVPQHKENASISCQAYAR